MGRRPASLEMAMAELAAIAWNFAHSPQALIAWAMPIAKATALVAALAPMAV